MALAASGDPLEFVLGSSEGQPMRRAMDDDARSVNPPPMLAADEGWVSRQAFERLKQEFVQLRGVCMRLQSQIKTLETRVHKR
jgi:hypothetical protein